MLKLKNKSTRRLGFTIVELLVVIVVIGILATVTIVAYTGVSNRAKASAIQADLSSASKQLELYKAENGMYPRDATNGGTQEELDLIASLPCSDGLTCTDYASDGTTYHLTITDGGSIAYNVTNGGVVEEGEYGGGSVALGTVSNYRMIDSGSETTCAIKSGSLYCWGRGQLGQIGNESTDNQSTPVPVSGGFTFKTVASGDMHTCAIASNDIAYCWGYAGYGALGNNDNVTDLTSPNPVQFGVHTAKAIEVGDWHTCAIAEDDNLYCWGSDMDGVLGNAGSFTDSMTPILINGGGLSGKTVKSISLGTYHSCAIASDDLAYCWGANGNGQLGDGTTDPSEIPVQVAMAGDLAGKTVRQVALGDRSTCILASDNKVYCWGNPSNSQLGGSSQTSPVATGSIIGKTIESISVSDGGYHVCALATDDTLHCWGYNSNGQLGNESLSNSADPVLAGMPVGVTPTSIATGDQRTCIIGSDTNTYCWGYQGYGVLGNGATTGFSLTPVTAIYP